VNLTLNPNPSRVDANPPSAVNGAWMSEEEIEQRTAEAEERSNEAERSEGIQNTGNGQGALVKWKD
jgi:F0F1-type ATP synthase epsilon subunit